MKRIPLIDDAFLRLESRRMPLHIGMLLLLDPPKDAPANFAQQIAERLREHTETVPPFNQCLVMKNGMHYWEEDLDFDLDQHFAHLSLPAPGRIRELLAMVSRIHSGHLDRSYPLWRMYLIEGIEDGRIALYLKMHHAMVDGMSGIKMLMESMSTNIETSATMPPPWSIGIRKSGNSQLPVPAPAMGGFSAISSLAKEGVKASAKSAKLIAKELRSTFNDFRQKNPDLAVGGMAPRSIFNEKISASRRFAAQSYSMPRIKAVASAYGATSNDVILAMCGAAMRKYLEVRGELPEVPLLAAVPVSVRRPGRQSNAANEVAFTMAHLATHIDDPAERLKAIKTCMDYNKQRIQELSPGQLMTYAAMMLLPGATNTLLGYAPHKTLASVVISHVPGPREDYYWQGAKLSGLYPVSLVIDGGALNITIISRHDLVDFGIIACRKTVPQVQRLLEYLEDGLSELEATLKPKSTGTKSKPAPAAKAKPKVRKARSASAKSASTAEPAAAVVNKA